MQEAQEKVWNMITTTPYGKSVKCLATGTEASWSYMLLHRKVSINNFYSPLSR